MLILSKSITLTCRISTHLAAAFSIKPSSFSLPVFGFFSFLPSSFTAPFLFLVSVCSLTCKRKAKYHGRWRRFCGIRQQIQNKKSIFQSILMSQRRKSRREEVYLEQVVHFCPLCHYFTLGGLCYSPSAREVLFHWCHVWSRFKCLQKSKSSSNICRKASHPVSS